MDCLHVHCKCAQLTDRVVFVQSDLNVTYATPYLWLCSLFLMLSRFAEITVNWIISLSVSLTVSGTKCHSTIVCKKLFCRYERSLVFGKTKVSLKINVEVDDQKLCGVRFKVPPSSLVQV